MNHARRSLILSLAAAGLCAAAPVLADERGTREEARALAEAAAAHIKKVGLEQAVKSFGSDKARWTPKDLYPFVLEFSGVMRFHVSEKMINKNVLDVRDASGKEFGKEMVAVAKSPKGSGWVDYEWQHPATKRIEDKSAMIVHVPGTDYLVGVGVYR